MQLGRKGELITHDKDHAVLTLMDIDKVIETNFASITSNMNLGEIVNTAVIQSKRNIFPVIDAKTRALVGIILLDDLRSIMFDQDLYGEVRAHDLMQPAPEIIDFDKDKMTDIMQKFQDSSAWNLPVVKDNKYIGFISKSKLLTAYRRQLINFTKE
jgi:CIC family chloride channel protein